MRISHFSRVRPVQRRGAPHGPSCGPVVAGSSPGSPPFSPSGTSHRIKAGRPLEAHVDTAVGLELVETSVRRRGPWRQAVVRFRRRPLGIVALLILLVLFVVVLLAAPPAPSPEGNKFLDSIKKPQPPFSTPHHLFGTDV